MVRYTDKQQKEMVVTMLKAGERPKAVAEAAQISLAQAYRLKKTFETMGTPWGPSKAPKNATKLKEEFREKPNMHLKELKQFLALECNIHVSQETVRRHLANDPERLWVNKRVVLVGGHTASSSSTPTTATPTAPRPHQSTAPNPQQPPPTMSRSQPTKRQLGDVISPQPQNSQTTPAPKRIRVNRAQPSNATSETMNAPAAAAAPTTDAVDYCDLKAWIAEQEAQPQPAPLTPAERNAIAELRSSLAARRRQPEPPEPVVDDNNWVGLLHRYRDAHQLQGVEVSFEDSSNSSRPGQSWLCQCTLKGGVAAGFDGGLLTFPRPGAGYVDIGGDGGDTQAPPAFARKKDAKQYAAKCCVEWLMANMHMPSDGEAVVFSKGKPKPPVPGKASATLPSKPSAALGNGSSSTNSSSSLPNKPPSQTSDNKPAESNASNTPATSRISTPQIKKENINPATTTTTPTIDVHDDDIPATKRVNEMCSRLGIVPPQYQLTVSSGDDESAGGFFSGYPTFGVDSVQMPDGLGRVTNCYSRKMTREKIAEEVLVYLLTVEAERAAAAEELLEELLGE
ncbi:hypothetical protein B0T17DRAFT_616349 [Bombardia bombarda]|uniref:Uncharacterized protein n=1 Tax=Bombardia bombarda TaxID=252184 RepID=A0AA39XC52_9PEZI|nr:hypothetical protein B0T17DRAFT_616349 [Bombardia bombarda]